VTERSVVETVTENREEVLNIDVVVEGSGDGEERRGIKRQENNIVFFEKKCLF
jgi:hypothetical protein